MITVAVQSSGFWTALAKRSSPFRSLFNPKTFPKMLYVASQRCISSLWPLSQQSVSAPIKSSLSHKKLLQVNGLVVFPPAAQRPYSGASQDWHTLGCWQSVFLFLAAKFRSRYIGTTTAVTLCITSKSSPARST